MKNSEILRRARDLVEDDECKYVCIAIQYAAPTFDVRDLRVWIHSLMYEEYDSRDTLENWLALKHPQLYYTYFPCSDDMKHLRLRWIDWMIAYWETVEKAQEDNPDLPQQFVIDSLKGLGKI